MLNLEGKLKGNDKALYNHVDRKISGQIHLKIHQSKGKQYFPRACYQMRKKCLWKISKHQKPQMNIFLIFHDVYKSSNTRYLVSKAMIVIF